MTAFAEFEVFTKRQTVKIGVTLRVPTTGVRYVTVAAIPLEGETVAQFAARVMQEHCGSIARAKEAVIEIRVVAEGEG